MGNPLSTLAAVLKPPVELLSEIGKLNPGFASLAVMLPIFAAAVAAGLSYFDNDPSTAFLIGVVAVCFLVVLLVVSAIAKGMPELTSTIVWFVRFILTIFALTLIVLFTSVVFAWPREPHCIFTFKREAACLVSGTIVTQPATTSATPPIISARQWSEYLVFPQYLRTSLPKVDALRRGLVGRGWRVQEPQNMEGIVSGSWNEIRVAADMDRAAVEQLAADVSAALDGRRIQIRVHPRVRPSRPEVWISD